MQQAKSNSRAVRVFILVQPIVILRVEKQENKTMTFKLGRSIQVGQKIKTNDGWRKVLKIDERGAFVKEGLIEYGQTVYGWKSK